MSRTRTADQREVLEHDNRALAEQLAEMRGEAQGARAVAVHVVERSNELAAKLAVAEQRAQRAVGDVRTLLRLVAGHVLDVRAGVNAPTAVDLLVDELAAHGLPLRGALQQLQFERASAGDAEATVSAAEAAAAVANAPVPRRTLTAAPDGKPAAR